MIYPLTEHEQQRVRECAAAFIARIPEPERWLILDGAKRSRPRSSSTGPIPSRSA
jgi:hypothetical protein